MGGRDCEGEFCFGFRVGVPDAKAVDSPSRLPISTSYPHAGPPLPNVHQKKESKRPYVIQKTGRILLNYTGIGLNRGSKEPF
jgi:hypothetical protein